MSKKNCKKNKTIHPANQDNDFTKREKPGSVTNTISRRKLVENLLLGTGFITIGNYNPSKSFNADHAIAGEKERWLIVAAHPDDESKASSLVFTERKPDDELIILVMRLVGEGRPYDRESWTAEEGIKTRYTEMKRSVDFLKANDLRWWLPPHPKNEIIVKNPESVKKMAHILNEIKPTRVFTHWGLGDSHPDHVGTAEIVKEAIKLIDIPNNLKKVYYFGECGSGKKLQNFTPNYFADISEPSVLASVLWSFTVHRSQVYYERLKDHLNYLKKYGQKSGYEYADPFVMYNLKM